MSEFKRACSQPNCEKQGARFIAPIEKPKGAWYCYSHGDEIMAEVTTMREAK